MVVASLKHAVTAFAPAARIYHLASYSHMVLRPHTGPIPAPIHTGQKYNQPSAGAAGGPPGTLIPFGTM